MFDLTIEDFDLLTDEEFEALELEVGRLTSCWKVSNMRGGSAIYWDDQRIGEKRHEYMALKHPSVNVEAEMAFRNKAVVDSLEGNSLHSPADHTGYRGGQDQYQMPFRMAFYRCGGAFQIP